jgi:hypothetical protein
MEFLVGDATSKSEVSSSIDIWCVKPLVSVTEIRPKSIQLPKRLVNIVTNTFTDVSFVVDQ